MEGPWCSLKASAAIDGNRFVRTDTSAGPKTGEEDLQGDISAGAGYSAALDISFSPDPNGLAVMDCPPSNKPLNQYVITDGIPCVVHYGGTDGSFAEQLRQNTDWIIPGAGAPLPLLPRLPNQSDQNGSAYSIYPMHSGPNGSSVRGLAFDLSNGLPALNSAFGPNTVIHQPLGQNVAAAIALFFPSTASNHPSGGPISVDGSPVPNYIFYYDQVWQNPWGIEVRFWNQDSSQYSYPDSFVKVGTDSHGLSGAGQYGEPDADGGLDTDLFAKLPSTGQLVWVGQQKIRGLDLYVRNVYHECVHKRLREAIANGAVDADPDQNGNPVGDLLPDSIENQIGTSSNKVDSTGWGVDDDTGEITSYYRYADSEVFARMNERDLLGPDADWADDGFNWGRPAAPNRCQRILEVFWPNYTKEGLDWPNAVGLVP